MRFQGVVLRSSHVELSVSALILFLCLSAAEYVPTYPFLYATALDANASFPVIEHLAPLYRRQDLSDRRTLAKILEGAGDINNNNGDDENDDRPAFIYATTEGYRIVEYYLHWCNTCKLYSTVFRKFATKLIELAAQQGIADIKVYAVSCSPNRKLCVDQAVKGFPKIRLYQPGAASHNYTFELAHHTHLNPSMALEQLGIDFDRSDGDTTDWESESGAFTSDIPIQDRTLLQRLQAWVLGKPPLSVSEAPLSIPRRTREDRKADIHLSFNYAMRYEIYTSSEALTVPQQQVLRKWFELLVRTLPSTWQLTKLIQELIDNFVYVVQSDDYLVAVLDEFPASTDRWSASCSRGVPDDGYTCGLWQLFHAMTVGLVDYNRAAFDPETILVTETAARTLRDYIDTFFGCETCRENFVSTFDACGHDRCDSLSDYAIDDENEWMELPMWLFRTHNAVNVRLLREQSVRERTELTKNDIMNAQWPLVTECSVCWNDNVDDGNSKEEGEIGRTWDATMIYKFLRLEYGQRDAFAASLRLELMPEVVSGMPSSLPDTDTLSNTTTEISETSFWIQLAHAAVFVLSVAALNASRKDGVRTKDHAD